MENRRRKSLRLREYDYAQPGGYFITICTNDRACILSRVKCGSEMERSGLELTELGVLAEQVLRRMASQYGIRLDAYAIMPNHIHIVAVIEEKENRGISIGRFVGAFKSIVSNEWRKRAEGKGARSGKIWQRDFYDHIIRNEADYLEKLKYIEENPDKWSLDELYTDMR